MFTPMGLDHVVLVVGDQQASQRFYTDVLGCTVDHVNERISLIHLRFGEAYIDLLPVTAERPRGAGGREGQVGDRHRQLLQARRQLLVLCAGSVEGLEAGPRGRGLVPLAGEQEAEVAPRPRRTR